MIWYLMGINVFAFFIYGIDKYLAIKNKYRVSEYSLFILSIAGGSIGAILGMKTFHHKTRKMSFWIVNFLTLIIWLLIIFQ